MNTDPFENNSVVEIESVGMSGSNGHAIASPIAKPVKIQRPIVKGKFLFIKNKKFWIRGVTYGTFRPDESGDQFPKKETVRQDFALMVENNINTVRVYTPPPVWLLDTAQDFGLRIMLGLPWEQHITFLDDKKVAKKIKNQIRQKVKEYAGHPAILCYAIGNEIPSNIVRWYGARQIESFLRELYDTVKAEDPEGLVTYVNFPPTEYLQLPFLDLFCFNVYLESQQKLSDYLMRLQNLSGERPLIMAEIGLDSLRNGEERQAEILDWQIKTAFKKGAAGVLLFSWTDEWYRGGFEILDWDFGITDRNRQPKLALRDVKKNFDGNILNKNIVQPFFSIAVCTLNGAETLRECLDAIFYLDYSNYEVILISDGSTDDTVAIAEEYDCKIIATENRGLSSARNTAWQTANGDIVVYIDDDAYPDPDWLNYLAITFIETDFAAVGGPNLPPSNDGFVAQCVANAPGNPTHVLISDQEAEHIPGCNMAFRREALEGVGGFDPIYRAAGDDVDICWKIQERGWKIGFHPAAVVWHHRRNKIATYWKQQKGYGKAEALLEIHWPQKFNAVGHLSWGGRLYTSGKIQPLIFPRSKVEYGIWGTGFFQSLYERDPNKMSYFPLLPEWYLLVATLLGTACIGFIWSPLLWVFPLAGAALTVVFLQAISSVSMIHFGERAQLKWLNRLKLKLVTGYLFLLQPLARLYGRLECGLTMWRRRHTSAWALPRSYYHEIWNEDWKSPEDWLTNFESVLRDKKVEVKRGGIYDQWDLQVREGLSMPTRVLMAIEEHGSGKQLVRFRIWARYKLMNLIPVAFFLLIGILAAIDQAWLAAIVLFGITTVLSFCLFQHCLPLTLSCLRELEHSVKKDSTTSLNGTAQ